MKRHIIDRRDFLAAATGTAASLSLGGLFAFGQNAAGSPICWKRDASNNLFVQCELEGRPISSNAQASLLDAFFAIGTNGKGKKQTVGKTNPTARLGPVKAQLSHKLLDSGGANGPDLLEATLRLTNTSDKPQEISAGFIADAQPGSDPAEQRAYLPLAASGQLNHWALKSLGYGQEKDPDRPIGAKSFAAYYLEPAASDPDARHGRAMLLAPVVDIYQPGADWRVALFTPSGEPQCFAASPVESGARQWNTRGCQTIGPGKTVELRCYLMVHRGEADTAWRAYNRFAHDDPHPKIGWLGDVRAHYYDFLSAKDANGPRGGGYDADLAHFRRFRVGLATQHGYYPWWGQYIDPKQKEWQAMRADKRGPAPMSLDKMRERIAATRREGAKAAVYMHLTGLNENAPVFDKLRDCVLIDEDGRPVGCPWEGPDTPGKNWHMSMAARPWREHLLGQARLIMETLSPDAIVMDETFSGLGYDEHPDRRGPLSQHTIAFLKEIRKLIRSFGEDRAFLTSDCSLAGFVPWADGEAGDHAYASLLGNPLYRKTPVRYTAALGDKAWVPCAWNFRRFWDAQMDLARKIGSGVGLSNGWEEYTGLARLPADVAKKIESDIASL